MTVAPHETNNLKGIGFMIMTCVIMTTSATIVKTLGQDMNSFQLAMIRCLFTVLITIIINYRIGMMLLETSKPKLIFFRSFMTFVVMTTNIYALTHLPMVQVTAIQFSKPLFLVVLAAIFLGETVRIYRTSATIIGFVGILVILHPWDNGQSGGFQIAHLAALTAATAMAVLAILSRIMTKDHNTTTLVFYANSITALLCAIPAAYYWMTPTLDQLLMIAALGLTTFCAQYCMISAYKNAEVTVVTPFEYLRIIFTAAAGYLIFSEIPDRWTIWGGALVCASTLFIAYREAYKRRQEMKRV